MRSVMARRLLAAGAAAMPAALLAVTGGAPLAGAVSQTSAETRDGIERREVFIPMPDGVRLAADLFVPAGQTAPLPVLLEYLPYRKPRGAAATTRCIPTSSAAATSSPASTFEAPGTAKAG